METVSVFCFVLVVVAGCYWYGRSRKRIFERIHRHLKPSDRILDVGSGDGCLVSLLRQHGFNCQGLDVVKRFTCAEPILFDGVLIPFQDATFDVVLCNFVLHHVASKDHQLALLQEMRRISRRLVIIFEDTPENALDWELADMHAQSDWGSCRACFHTATEWKRLLSGAGFVLRAEEVMQIPRHEYPFAATPWFYPLVKTGFVAHVST